MRPRGARPMWPEFHAEMLKLRLQKKTWIFALNHFPFSLLLLPTLKPGDTFFSLFARRSEDAPL